MRVRAFQDSSLVVDIARGDIFEESGNVLITGRPRGIRTADSRLSDPSEWERLEESPSRRILRYGIRHESWDEIYAFNYHSSSRARLPSRESPHPHHFISLCEDLDWLMSHSSQRAAGGDFVLGFLPFSWRNGNVVAHAMASAIAGLCYTMRMWRGDVKHLTVLIRSLDEPTELYQVFDGDYFRDFRTQLSWPQDLCEVWSTDCSSEGSLAVG